MRRLTSSQWQTGLLVLMAFFLLIGLLPASCTVVSQPKEVAYSEFLAAVRAGQLSDVSISQQTLTGTLRADSGQQAKQYIVTSRLPGFDETELLKELAAHQVRYTGRFENESGWIQAVLTFLAPLVILFLLFGVGARRMAQGPGDALTFGKNPARIYDQSSQNKITFADVAGVDEAEAELVEIVDFLKNPQKYQQLGGRIPKGVLLPGPPGTGKTLLAYDGVISTGAASDLERASELARQMVTRFGMSERPGHLTYGHPVSSRFLSSMLTGEERNYSEHTAELIDAEVRQLVDDAYLRVSEILTRRRTELERIAHELIRSETLDRAELDRLLNAPALVETGV